MEPYQFVSHAPEHKPWNDSTKLIEKIGKVYEHGGRITRIEKDKLANILYGIGSGHSPTYKLMGWAWSCSFLPEFIVEYTYGGFYSYRAVDKTALRSAIRSILRIIEVK